MRMSGSRSQLLCLSWHCMRLRWTLRRRSKYCLKLQRYVALAKKKSKISLTVLDSLLKWVIAAVGGTHQTIHTLCKHCCLGQVWIHVCRAMIHVDHAALAHTYLCIYRTAV